jgi:hypothetical protein
MRMFIAAGLLLLLGTDLRIAEANQGPNPNQDLSVKVPRPRDPLAGADKETREKLEEIKVNTPSIRNWSLGDMLTFFADRWDLKIEFDERAFQRAGVADVLKKQVVHPEVTRASFANVLTDILAQVRGEFYVKGDTIIIVPKSD